MWLITNKAFVSVVAYRGMRDPNYKSDDRDATHLLVRGRYRGDIEVLFPDAIVEETKVADYRFRTVVPIHEVAGVCAMEASRIDYTNFKSSVTNWRRKALYMDLWSILHRAQSSLWSKQPALPPARVMDVEDDRLTSTPKRDSDIIDDVVERAFAKRRGHRSRRASKRTVTRTALTRILEEALREKRTRRPRPEWDEVSLSGVQSDAFDGITSFDKLGPADDEPDWVDEADTGSDPEGWSQPDGWLCDCLEYQIGPECSSCGKTQPSAQPQNER